VHVGCREAEETESGVHEAVLASVVLGEALTVGAAVVLHGEPRGGVVEVGPAQEVAALVAERNLRLRPRQPGEDQEQAQARLHRRLGRRLGQLDDLPELGDACLPRMACHVLLELIQLDEAFLQRHVCCDNGFDQRWAAAEIRDGAKRRGGQHAPSFHDFVIREIGAVD
jgi:hypothetical protein